MKATRLELKKHLLEVLKHLYINPLEKCNLRCKICYTRKTSPILTKEEILEFIDRYKNLQRIESVTFCGGEVFTLKYFPDLVNEINQSNIFVQIITNGTIDKLSYLLNPNLINLIVSLDGLPKYHDKNRGEGNFAKSISFLQKAKLAGFQTEVFSIVTKQNFKEVDHFEKLLENKLGYTVSVTYHPRKPLSYLQIHPISNIVGEIVGFDFLAIHEMKWLMKKKKTFPPKNLGCYQISLVSDGKVYGCCEGTVSLGTMKDDVKLLFERLEERLEIWEKNNRIKKCLGCSQPDFVCGIKKYI